jgi:TRAP transporter TAXI family solute receptor
MAAAVRLVGLALATVAVASACRHSTPPTAVTPTIRIGAGSTGGDFAAMAGALAKTLANETPRLDVDVVVTQGGISSLESVQRGESDCGFSYSNVAYEAFAGRLSNEPAPLRRLRGVALVQISPLYFLVRKGAPIKSVPDLRGRSVALGGTGSASSRAGMLVLNAFGLDTASVRLKDGTFRPSFHELKNGRLDAIFIVAAEPSLAVTRGIKEGAQLLPVDGPAIDTLREHYPFLHPLSIPAGVYPGQREPVRTIGIESLLLCREDVPAEHVQRVTDGWMKTFAQLVRDGQLADSVNASLASATPIPLHTGATAYYRSRQVLHR